MQALLNGEAETPFTPGEVAKGEHGADPAPGGTTEVEVEDEDSTAVDGRSVYVGNVRDAYFRPEAPNISGS